MCNLRAALLGVAWMIFWSFPALAMQTGKVSAQSAEVHARPDDVSPVIARLKQGNAVRLSSEARAGWYRIEVTKGRRIVGYIRALQVTPGKNIAAPTAPIARAQVAPPVEHVQAPPPPPKPLSRPVVAPRAVAKATPRSAPMKAVTSAPSANAIEAAPIASAKSGGEKDDSVMVPAGPYHSLVFGFTYEALLNTPTFEAGYRFNRRWAVTGYFAPITVNSTRYTAKASALALTVKWTLVQSPKYRLMAQGGVGAAPDAVVTFPQSTVPYTPSVVLFRVFHELILSDSVFLHYGAGIRFVQPIDATVGLEVIKATMSGPFIAVGLGVEL